MTDKDYHEGIRRGLIAFAILCSLIAIVMFGPRAIAVPIAAVMLVFYGLVIVFQVVMVGLTGKQGP